MAFIDEQLDELMARFQQQRERAAELRRRVAAISVSVTAPRKVVTVTVGAHGELRSVEFPVEAYKRMTRAELAEVVMATAGRAKENALEQLAGLLGPELPPGTDVAGLVRGTTDFAAALPEGRLQIPAEVSEYLNPGRPGGDGGAVRGE